MSGNPLGGPEAAAQSDIDTSESLYGLIDRQNVHGLNLTVPEDAKATIKPWDERESVEKYAESNVDDQMIIHIPFVENVRLRSLLLKVGGGEFAPQHLRIFANHANIVDFSDAEDTKPALNISLQDGVSVVEYPLRTAAFANIFSLSLYFDNSVGGEQTRVYYIGFKGDSRQNRNQGTNKLQVPAANAADASLVDRAAERRAAQQPTAK